MKRKCKRCGKEFRTAFTLHTCFGVFRGGIDDKVEPDAKLTRAHVDSDLPWALRRPPVADAVSDESVQALSTIVSAIAESISSSDPSPSYDSSPSYESPSTDSSSSDSSSSSDFSGGGGDGGGGGASGDY